MHLQPTLFDHPLPITSELIPGLLYLPEFITPLQEQDLLARIDQHPWDTSLKRRVQHYGYRYDYTTRNVSPDSWLGPLPDWLFSFSQHLHQQSLFQSPPDQIIINEYLPGQGISAHIDCIPCFSATIASLSLGSACVMEFFNPSIKKRIPVLLEPRSLLIVSGDARYQWLHSIPARKTDLYEGISFTRNRRISLTFRNMIIHHKG
ncbi:MAG: alpha-ketoglutarate-dependent dioxygenase AlkB [Alphaproteobacteria bacterium]|nr:alpha-ketoglutarate-dependent dioxygenase AlkB [Alphaproteobacteria bacterium]